MIVFGLPLRSLIILTIITIILALNHDPITKKGTIWYDNQYYAKWIESVIPHLFKNNLKKHDTESECEYILPTKFGENPQRLYSQLCKFSNKVFLSLPNPDCIGKKDMLWNNLVKYHGIKEAMNIMPMSYSLPLEYTQYKKNFSSHRKMMFKKNTQRQKGLYLTNKFQTEKQISDQKYIVAQQYLEHPLLYRSHKINLRVYLVLVCTENTINAYVFNDGIVSYTPKAYNPNSVDDNSHISSFYNSKPLYKKGFPITTKRLIMETKLPKGILYSQINDKSKSVVQAITPEILNSAPCSFGTNKCVELFGIDFFVDEDLKCKILEVNIGPGMESENKEDNETRSLLLSSMCDLIISNNSSNFFQIQ